MDIASAKERRDELWSRLDQIQAKKEPLMVKERAVRKEIKQLQDDLYKAEMGK